MSREIERNLQESQILESIKQVGLFPSSSSQTRVLRAARSLIVVDPRVIPTRAVALGLPNSASSLPIGNLGP